MAAVTLMIIGTDLRIDGSLGTIGIGTDVDIYFEAKGGVAPHATFEVLNLLPEPDYTVVEESDGRVHVTGTATIPSGDMPFTLTLRGIDSEREEVEQTFALRVIPLPLELAGSVAPITVGTPMTDDLALSGGVKPRNVLTSTLPAGLAATIDDDNDKITISGTPTGAGLGPGASKSFEAAVTAGDAVDSVVAWEQTISITVPAVAWSPTYPDGEVDEAYDYTPSAATGGTGGYTYAVTSGTLPPGLTFVASSGRLHGTPTDDSGSPYAFAVTATDSEGNESTPSSQSVDITIPVTYATWSVIGSGIALSNGNKTATKSSGSNYRSVRADIGRNSGKPEFEITFTGSDQMIIGLCDAGPNLATSTNFIGSNAENIESYGYLNSPARIYRARTVGSGNTALGTSYGPGDVVTVSLDYAANQAKWQVNGVLVRTESINSGRTWYPAISMFGTTNAATINSGQSPLAHSLSGYEGGWTA